MFIIFFYLHFLSFNFISSHTSFCVYHISISFCRNCPAGRKKKINLVRIYTSHLPPPILLSSSSALFLGLLVYFPSSSNSPLSLSLSITFFSSTACSSRGILIQRPYPEGRGTSIILGEETVLPSSSLSHLTLYLTRGCDRVRVVSHR